MNGRKTGRKLISFILSLVMIIGMVPMSAAAAPATDDNSTSANVSKVLSYAAQMREENQKDDLSVGPFSWDTEKKKDTWRYFNGLMMDAFLMTGDESSAAFAKQFYDDNILDDGKIPDYGIGELDAVESARGLFDLLDGSIDNDKYELAIQFVYSELEKQTAYEQCGGNYLHKQEEDGEPTSSWSDWNIGLDGLYMAEPFLMECANAIDEGKLALTGADEQPVTSASIYAAVYNRFKWVAENMKDAETGLYHHGWNVKNSEGNGHFWARGIGWYAMAQVDIIEMMPEGEYRLAMIAQLPAFFDAMLTYQDADSSMWYNVVNRDDSLTDKNGNKLETSGSAMMAYALMKAYNNGYVSDAKYGEAGLKAFNGIVENKVSGEEGNYTVADIYEKSGVGTSDEYYCSETYNNDEAKGTGALIMAATLANATAALLPDSPDPGEGDTPESVKDETTGVSVSGTSATAITVEDKSADTTVINALADKLEDGFKAYDITLTDYTQGTEATVTMPAPAGADKVYYVSDDGVTVEEIAGAVFDGETVTFTTTHFSIFAAGQARIDEVVDDNPYEGLTPAEDYPSYPDDGAVRIDKTAIGQDFNSTGAVKVELGTAGISVQSGVDVVLVVDVSNSMGWSTENAGGTNDADRLPSSGEQDKLTDAMNAASAFADILLGDNEEGNTDNNTLSFVTFAGLDTDNAQTPQTTTTRKKGNWRPEERTETYIDSVMTVFTGETSAEAARKSFDNTRFYNTDLAVNDSNRETGSVYYYLNIAGTNGQTIESGLNRGNTNYDYAFWQAKQAVNKLQRNYANYNESGRETVVVFMTDGAPSHYNGYRSNGNAADYLPDTEREYPDTNSYPEYSSNNVKGTWYNYIANNNNRYATDLANSVSSLHAVGFDLAHGGFSSYQWTEEELTSVLERLVADRTLPVMAASDRDALYDFYQSLAMQIKYAGTNAKVTDTIKSDFTLLTTQNTGTAGGEQGALSQPPKIEVRAYDLWSKAETPDEDLIGTRKDEGTPLETVSFSNDGQQAFSDKVENGSRNIMTSAPDGSVTIAAQSFTYTKDAFGVERFVWNIGNITDQEMALSYYAYLKGSMEGKRDGGVYDTNENAVLEYVDINGDYANQTFPLPKVNWQGAITTIQYYLVNEDGHPVNENGVVIPFANRIVVGDGEIRTFNLNDSLTVNGSGYTPVGYELYNPDARYTVQANSDGSGSLMIEDTKAISGSSEITTRRIDEDEDNYTATAVAFGVILRGKPELKTPLSADQIVIDYGKAVQVDVTANEDTSNNTTYEVVGFMRYDPSADTTQTQFTDGARTFNADNGQFTITRGGKVQYQLNRMLSEVEKIFAVVKVTPNGNVQEAYRMLNELDVIPATSVYYETDFADGVFTYAETDNSNWVTMPENGTSDKEVQNDGTIGHNAPYGYDDSYTDDTGFSNGTSEYINAVDGGLNKTYTEFTFTGTGFDLISRTGVNAGMIQAQIYQGPEVTDTVYKKATVANVGASELYQIPVLSCEGMEYGTYTVRIQVFEAYEDAIIPALSRGGEFYFDAVRIYDPINVEGAELTGDSQIAQTAYEADTEAYVQHMEIRDAIISSSQFDSTDADAEGEGVVYIDATQTSAIESSDSATVIDYDMAGPNNELYLKYSSTSVGFILYTDHIPESLQIGAKSALGGYVYLDASIQNPTDEEVLAFNSAEFNHATAQNYSTFVDDNEEIVADYSEYFNETQDGRYYTYVFISNLADDDQILSITDIKATFAEPSSMSFGYSTALLTAFNNRLQSETPDIPSEPAGPQLISADFTTDTIRYVKKAELQVITSADVEKVVVLDEDGDDMKPTLDPQMDENGNKTWALNFKVGKPGTHSFTVYGVDKDGNQTSTATVSIEATRK